jgi:hypothetical protein
MIDRQDQPVLEPFQPIQAAVLALEVVTLEYLHGICARDAH